MYSEDFLERFWAKVNKTETCWLWTGATTRGGGYASIRVDGKDQLAHRVSLQIHLGRAITKGLDVAHAPIICHTRHCVNPSHLREATRSENVLDTYIDGTMIRASGAAHKRPRHLTEDQIRAIRVDTRPQKVIAEEYDVDQSRISCIKSRKIYTWVTD